MRGSTSSAFVADRLARCPRFTWRVQEVPLADDLPYWVEGGSIDIHEHVRRVAVPAPGTQHELLELASFLYQGPLDRDKTLWEMYFIEGLQGGRCAFFWKMHHCLIDGMSGAGLIELLLHTGPEITDEPLVPMNENQEAGAPPSLGDMLRRGIENGHARPRALGRHLGAFGKNALRGWLDGEASEAPRVSFNDTVSAERAFAWASLPLGDVKRVKDVMGVTVNDVVLALTSGSVRRYLEQRDELPKVPLVASIPVSTRKAGDTSLGNQIIDVPVPWATHIEDPLERVAVIRNSMRQVKKADHKAGGLIPLIAESFPPAVAKAAMHYVSANQEDCYFPSNAVVSNVPSSPVPLYFAGARVESMLPISILAATQGLNITVLSYCGELHFGLTVDPKLVPEPGILAEGIAKSRVELQEALDRRG